MGHEIPKIDSNSYNPCTQSCNNQNIEIRRAVSHAHEKDPKIHLFLFQVLWMVHYSSRKIKNESEGLFLLVFNRQSVKSWRFYRYNHESEHQCMEEVHSSQQVLAILSRPAIRNHITKPRGYCSNVPDDPKSATFRSLAWDSGSKAAFNENKKSGRQKMEWRRSTSFIPIRYTRYSFSPSGRRSWANPVGFHSTGERVNIKGFHHHRQSSSHSTDPITTTTLNRDRVGRRKAQTHKHTNTRTSLERANNIGIALLATRHHQRKLCFGDCLLPSWGHSVVLCD